MCGDGEHHPFAAPSRSSTHPTKSEKFSPRGLVADPAMLSRYFLRQPALGTTFYARRLRVDALACGELSMGRLGECLAKMARE